MILLERDQTLQALAGLLEEARGGHGRVALIRGEAGIGKTSLTEAFLADVGDGVRTAMISCDGLKMPGAFGALHDVADLLWLKLQVLLGIDA